MSSGEPEARRENRIGRHRLASLIFLLGKVRDETVQLAGKRMEAGALVRNERTELQRPRHILTLRRSPSLRERNGLGKAQFVEQKIVVYGRSSLHTMFAAFRPAADFAAVEGTGERPSDRIERAGNPGVGAGLVVEGERRFLPF